MMGAMIRKEIPLYGYQTACFSTASTLYVFPSTTDPRYTPFAWEPTCFDGKVRMYFEAWMYVSGGTGSAGLHTTGGTLVTGSECTTTSGSLVRVRSGLFNGPAAGNYYYGIKNSGGGTTYLIEARVVILQNGLITKTQTYFQLGGYQTRALTAYANSWPITWGYTSANWSGTKAGYFEVVMAASGTTGDDVYARLVDTDGTVYATLTTDSTTLVRLRSGAITLTNGKHYFVELAGKTGSVTCIVTAARIILNQTSVGASAITTCYQWIRTADEVNTTATTDTLLASGNWTYWDSDEWNIDSVTRYVACNLHVNNAAATGYISVKTAGGTLLGTATGAGKTDYKPASYSGGVAPVDNTEYYVWGRVTSGYTVYASGVWLESVAAFTPKAEMSVAMIIGD